MQNQNETQTIEKVLNHLNDTEAIEQMQKHITKFATLMTRYKCAMMEIKTKFNVLNEEYSLTFERNPINTIKSRLKSPKSIKEKLERKNLPLSAAAIEDHLKDVAGIRVICPFLDDVYALAEALLKQDDITLLEQKDYIKEPKENGYRSLHLIVSVPIFLANEKHDMKVEIQLRTIAMDFWASLEHQLRYKKDHIFTKEMANDLFDCANQSAELDHKMNKLRKDIDIMSA